VFVQALDLMAKMLGFTEDEKQRVNEEGAGDSQSVLVSQYGALVSLY